MAPRFCALYSVRMLGRLWRDYGAESIAVLLVSLPLVLIAGWIYAAETGGDSHHGDVVAFLLGV